MAVGGSFNRRLAGNALKKATGIESIAGKMPNDYAYIELGGEILDGTVDGLVVVVPNVEYKISGRVFIEINPYFFQFGPCNYLTILEAGDDIMTFINTDADVELPDWCFRLYVAR